MFLLTPLISITLGLASVSSGPTNNCRCIFGLECWPSDSDFQVLASKISQPLLHPIPPATPCYNSAAGNCTEVQTEWYDGVWRSDQSGAAQNTNWETYTLPNGTIQGCYLNTSLGFPCQQGSVPVTGIDARTLGDVQEAVKFAGNHNLRLVIKNTGHDYLGRSSGRGSFLIWTHHMKNITFYDSFSPTGATGLATYNNAFTLGAGIQWFEAYEAAKARNVLIVGGFSLRGSVGAAGGWLAGGGHSALAPNYGLGVDNVLEIEIVTADGNLVIANSYQNRDLFWALRGGGGGTWGVVTSVTYKTHPSTPFSGAFLTVNSTNANSTQNLLEEIIRLTPSLVDQGYGGYGTGSTSQFQLILFSPNVTANQTRATFLPLFEFAASQPGLSVQNETAAFPDLWTIYNLVWNSTDGQVGNPVEVSSWLLPKDVVQTDDPRDLAVKLLKTASFQYNLVTGGQVSRVDPESTGLNPAWRNSLIYNVVYATWQEGANETQIEAARQRLIQDMKILEGIAPDSGAYLNEASRYEFDWKKSFFGSHYDQLLAIKQKYDPNYLFLVYEGIGSDGWDADLICRV